MTKKVKKPEAEKHLTDAILGSAHQIWLAGIGAFFKAEEESSRLFESLVKEGEAVEARQRQEVEKQTEEIRSRATETWDRLEQVFQERMGRSLGRLGVATHEDLQELRRLVEDLNQRVAVLAEAQGAAAKGGAKKSG